MSWQAVDAVLKYSQSRGSARLLLLCVAHHAQPDGTGARVAIPTLAAEAQIDERQTRRLLRGLEALGELEGSRGGGRKSSEYVILLPISPGSGTRAQEPGGRTNQGSGTRSALAPQPSIQETDVVVSDVALNKQTTGRAQLLAELEAEGVAHTVALELVSNPKYLQRVPLQLEYLSDREPLNRAAVLVDSIKKNYTPPKAYLERQMAAERQAAERGQRRREEASKAQVLADRSAADARAEVEKAEMDFAYSELSEGERAAVDAQVLARLGVLAQRGGEKAKGAIEATRRLVMKERGDA